MNSTLVSEFTKLDYSRSCKAGLLQENFITPGEYDAVMQCGSWKLSHFSSCKFNFQLPPH
jgi:hypothetical protein